MENDLLHPGRSRELCWNPGLSAYSLVSGQAWLPTTPLLGLSGTDGSTGPEPCSSLCSPWEEVGPCQDRDQGAACS